ncbi:DUF4023 family protein [Paenibacillus sp. HB172176]|nr:DUF4023 family protein [Paenibacillus sp. HB172176]
MDNTNEFVQQVQDSQRKAQKNKKRGQGQENAVLASKQHGTKK